MTNFVTKPVQQVVDEEKQHRYGEKPERERLRYRELRIAYEDLAEKFRQLERLQKDSDERLRQRLKALEATVGRLLHHLPPESGL